MYNRILFRPNYKLQDREIEELQSLPRSLVNINYSTIFQDYQIVDRIPIVIEKNGGFNILSLLSGEVYINARNGLFIKVLPTRITLPSKDGSYDLNLAVYYENHKSFDPTFFDYLSTYEGLDKEVYKTKVDFNIDGYPLFKVKIEGEKIEVLEYRGEPTKYVIPLNKYQIPRLFSDEITQSVRDLSDSFISSGFRLTKSFEKLRVSPGIAYIEGVRINILEPIYLDITLNGAVYLDKIGKLYFEEDSPDSYLYEYLIDNDNNLLTDNRGHILVDLDLQSFINFSSIKRIPLGYLENGVLKKVTRYKNINPNILIDRVESLEEEILILASQADISDTPRINSNINIIDNEGGDRFHPLYSAYYDPYEDSIQNGLSVQNDSLVLEDLIQVPPNIRLEDNILSNFSRSLSYIEEDFSTNGYVPFNTYNLIFDYFPKYYNDNLETLEISVEGMRYREDYLIFLNDVQLYDSLSPSINRNLSFNVPGAKLGDVVTIKDSENTFYDSFVIDNTNSINHSDYISRTINIDTFNKISDIQIELRAASTNTWCKLYIKSREAILGHGTKQVIKGNNIITLEKPVSLFPGEYEIILVFSEPCQVGSLNDQVKLRLIKENITPTFVNFQLDETINNIRTTNTNLQIDTNTGWKNVTTDLESRVNISPVNLRFVLDENKPVINIRDYYISRELTLDKGIWISRVYDTQPYTSLKLYVQGSFNAGSVDIYISSDKSETWTELSLVKETVVSAAKGLVNRVYEINDLSSTIIMPREGVKRRRHLSIRADLSSLEGITKILGLGYTLNS